MNGKIIYRQVPYRIELTLTRAELRCIYESTIQYPALRMDIRVLLRDWEKTK